MKCICEQPDTLFDIGTDYSEVNIKDGELRMYTSDLMDNEEGYIGVDIDYCPFCGKKLK